MPCDLKSPIRYARRGCPRFYSHRGASAAAVLVSLRRDTTLSACSYAFIIGQFRRWWYSSPPCSTFGGRRLLPNGLPCAPRSNVGLHLNQLLESKALLQYPLKLHWSLRFASSRVSVSPVQPALLPGSPRTDGFHVLIIDLPQGRDKQSDEMSKYTSSVTNSQVPPIAALARNDT